MADDKGGYEKILERLDQLDNRIGQLDNRIGQLDNRMDAQYRELKRDYRTLNARFSNISRKFDQLGFYDYEGYEISVRIPERGIDSIREPSYEKVDDFGPSPVPRKY